LIKTVAIGAGHRPFQSATPLGNTIGLDIGADVVGISVPEEFKTAISLASDTSSSEVPAVIYLPKLNIHKGFPAGINVGFSYISYQEKFKIIGFDTQWAFLRKPLAPNLAARFTGSYTKMYYIQTRTFGLDLIASKKLAVIDPYLGVGLQYWSGNLSIPAPPGTPAGIPLGVDADASSVSPHLFAGFPLKLVFLKLTGEIDYSFAGITTYGGKVSLSF
jgi:hypothetical protein